MSLGQQVPASAGDADNSDMDTARERLIELLSANERARTRTRLREIVIPGLEELVDSDASAADLIVLADRQAARLRTDLESVGDRDYVISLDPKIEIALEHEREWVRGYLHDTALQHLEWIAGDGLGTGLTLEQIAESARRAAADLRHWIERDDNCMADVALLPGLEQVAADARTLHSRVELVVDDSGSQLTSEQVDALVGAVREAVTNARKHAHATCVIVRVETAADGHTSVTVTDDGVGIDPELIASATGLGVKGSIVGRMERVGGHASLEDAPGGGTLVKLVTARQGA